LLKHVKIRTRSESGGEDTEHEREKRSKGDGVGGGVLEKTAVVAVMYTAKIREEIAHGGVGRAADFEDAPDEVFGYVADQSLQVSFAEALPILVPWISTRCAPTSPRRSDCKSSEEGEQEDEHEDSTRDARMCVLRDGDVELTVWTTGHTGISRRYSVATPRGDSNPVSYGVQRTASFEVHCIAERINSSSTIKPDARGRKD